ncbi:MAG: hypothetical protein U9N85_06405 [Bacteroidota bacterium]|nr:hypothetical protein [Bacteroidota bacterium]
MFNNHIIAGLAIIFAGLLVIVLSTLLRSFGIPDILLGYYTGPLIVLIGTGILIFGKDKPDE